MENSKISIPDKYSELQGIPLLQKAKNNFPVESGSLFSVTKNLFQAAEICVLNINDSWRKISENIESSSPEDLSILIRWNRSFSKILTELVYVFEDVFICYEDVGNEENRIRIDYENSSIFNELFLSLKQLDLSFSTKSTIDINNTVANDKISSSSFQILNSYRNTLHEIKIWESIMGKVHIPYVEGFSYGEFVGVDILKEAVFGLKIEGETIFTQFRSLHQIPEVLIAEVNDFIEKSILYLRADKYLEAVKCLKISNALLKIVNLCLTPIIENLSTREYHDIRENLGMTSGSQSENIYFHLFRDLYNQFASEMSVILNSEINKTSNDPSFFYLKAESLKLKNSIRKWRDLHLSLPFNHVGSNRTKSLIGANDAIDTVKNFRSSAIRKDKLEELRPVNFNDFQLTLFSDYLNKEDSFYKYLASLTGKITQSRFGDVQNRDGRFSEKVKFVPPDKRKV